MVDSDRRPLFVIFDQTILKGVSYEKFLVYLCHFFFFFTQFNVFNPKRRKDVNKTLDIWSKQNIKFDKYYDIFL